MTATINTLLAEVYGLQPAAIDLLAMFENAGPGVYRVEDAQVWVLRKLQIRFGACTEIAALAEAWLT